MLTAKVANIPVRAKHAEEEDGTKDLTRPGTHPGASEADGIVRQHHTRFPSGRGPRSS